jgi:hypothetical protein
MAQADADSIGKNVTFPLRLPASQERGDLLLQRWRLARAQGLPPHLRLDLGDDGQ